MYTCTHPYTHTRTYNLRIMFAFLLIHSFTQDGKTSAELAQTRGYRDIAKLIIDEGMYFITWDNKYAYHTDFIFRV